MAGKAAFSQEAILAVVEPIIYGKRMLMLALLGILTAVFAWYAAGTHVDAGFDKSIPLDHPYMKVLKQYEDDFGGANTVLVALIQKDKSKDIYNEHFLSKLKQVTDEIFFLPGIDRSRVSSVFTPDVRYVEVVEGGFAGGNVMNDALLSGSVDFIAAGPPAFITLWDRTRGSADHAFLDLHVWARRDMPLYDAHALSHVVKDRLLELNPRSFHAHVLAARCAGSGSTSAATTSWGSRWAAAVVSIMAIIRLCGCAASRSAMARCRSPRPGRGSARRQGARRPGWMRRDRSRLIAAGSMRRRGPDPSTERPAACPGAVRPGHR